METLPDRTSNAGPELQPPMDWDDQLWVADENIKAARRMAQDGYNYSAPGATLNRSRIDAIEHAIAALQEAKGLLCR